VAVRIRMKKMGRKHRPFFRICAVDSRSPRDGSVIEELGTYDPLVPDVDARVLLNPDRVGYWLSVGAKASVNVNVLIKKYGPQGTRLDEQKAARERLALPKQVPPAPEPVFVYEPPKPAEAPKAEAPKAEAASEVPATAPVAAESAAEEPVIEAVQE
jgi:small subunit ribosomal protein S16